MSEGAVPPFRRHSLSGIVSSFDTHSREALAIINQAIHLPRRLPCFDTSSGSIGMDKYQSPVICTSVRRTSLGFDDYVTFPTPTLRTRTLILDTTSPEFRSESPNRSKLSDLSNRPSSLTTEKISKFDTSCYKHPEVSKPVLEIPKIEPSSPIPKILTTDLDCPMCLQRLRESRDSPSPVRDKETDENCNLEKMCLGTDSDNESRDQFPSPDHLSPNIDRSVHFSDRNSRDSGSPRASKHGKGIKDGEDSFQPGQVFAITRPSLFGTSSKKVTFDKEFDSNQVVMTFHQRRDSNYPQFPSRARRPSAIVSTFLGTTGFGRRFSEDLRLKGIPGMDGDADGGMGDTKKVLFYQVFIPFLIAGFGNVAAGVLLEVVQHWPVYKSLPELFLLVASFLGFKGNLEMALAARLATQSHLGQLDRPSAQVKVLIGNLALIQAQAIVVGFLAALIAIFVNTMRNLDFNVSESLLLMSTSLATATITGLIMTVMMVVVTIGARRIGANPDNVSTLTAACLGDILAVIILSYSANCFWSLKISAPAFERIVVVSFLVILLPAALLVARKNCYTRAIIGTGWFPIIIAMCISSAGGLIFDYSVEYFDTIAIFEPIINGVGSNLVAVQASRISTYFHQRCDLGTLPDNDETGQAYEVCQTPIKAFFGSNPNVNTARFLLLMTIPGHVIYLLTMKWIQGSKVHLTASFVFFYLCTSTIQIIIVLYMAHIIVPWLWKKGHDPDNAAVPGLMATGDFFGSLLLTITFTLLYLIGDPNITTNPVKVIH